MPPFTIFPAIDLRNGNVVRLKYGDPKQQTTFSNDPLQTAQRWLDAGSQWLHIVNLDGAFGEKGHANWTVLAELGRLDCKIQFGGGIRTFDDIARALELGVTRIILGTVAIENPAFVSTAAQQFGSDHLIIGLDAKDGVVMSRGWQKDGGISVIELGKQMAEAGITTVLHTDIGRDGVLTGVNWQASQALAQATGLAVIGSGGVASLEDVLACVSADGVCGVITGRAIYDGRLDLGEAVRIINRRNNSGF